jgi:hypothetical protein
MCDCVCVCVFVGLLDRTPTTIILILALYHILFMSLCLSRIPPPPLTYTQYDVDVPYTSLLPQKLPYQRLAVDRRAAEREVRRLARVALLEEDEDEDEEEEEDEEHVRCRFVRTVLYCIVLYSTPL